jgi:hypothetical protein
MKYLRGFITLMLLHYSVAISAVPNNYTGNNPMVEMFLTMMDMFGMLDYNKGFNGSPYSNFYPMGYGAIPGLNSMSPLSSLNPMIPMTGINSMGATGFPQMSQFNASLLNNVPPQIYRSPLEGVWLGGNGDVLVFIGNKFFYSTSKSKHLTGNARIVENKIIADIDDSDKIMKFFFEIKGLYLAVRIKKEDVLYFKKQI